MAGITIIPEYARFGNQYIWTHLQISFLQEKRQDAEDVKLVPTY